MAAMIPTSPATKPENLLLMASSAFLVFRWRLRGHQRGLRADAVGRNSVCAHAMDIGTLCLE